MCKSWITEITDLNIAQNYRDFCPGHISRYKAPWAKKGKVKYRSPNGQVGNGYLSGETAGKFLQAGIELTEQRAGVALWRMWCPNKTRITYFLPGSPA